MANIRNNILAAVKTKIIELAAYGAADVAVGAIGPDVVNMGRGQKKVWLIQASDRATWEDGDELQRTLNVWVVLLMKIDQSAAETQTAQLNDAFDTVQAKIEELIDSPPTGVEMVHEDPAGIVVGGLDDKDDVVAAACEWRFTYLRDRESTS